MNYKIINIKDHKEYKAKAASFLLLNGTLKKASI